MNKLARDVLDATIAAHRAGVAFGYTGGVPSPARDAAAHMLTRAQIARDNAVRAWAAADFPTNEPINQQEKE